MGINQVGEGGGAGLDGLPGRCFSRGGYLAGGSNNPERGWGLMRHRYCGGGVEGGGGDTQSPLHRLHHLP